MTMSSSVAVPGRSSRRRDRLPPRFVVQAAMRARGTLLRLADRLVPAEIAVIEHAHSMTVPYLLATMVDLGVPDALGEGPRTADELARLVDADADALHRVLRAAATVNLVRLEPDGRFHETRLTRPLRDAAAAGVGDWCRYIASPSLHRAWEDLSTSTRNASHAFRRVHGTSIFGWFDEHPDEGTCFSRGLGALTLLEAPMIIGSYPFPDEGVVCDVGGGAGVLLGELLLRRPALRGMIVDAASVLEDASAHLEELGLSDRFEPVQGDFFDAVTARADLYLLKWVLHDWDDDACIRIVHNVADAMPEGARLLVIEGEQERARPHARFSMVDAQMLVVSDGGRERSASELCTLLTEAGMTVTSVRRTPTDTLLVEAVSGRRAA